MSNDRYSQLSDQQGILETQEAADTLDRYRDVDPDAMGKALTAAPQLKDDPLRIATEEPELPDQMDRRYSVENLLGQEGSEELRQWLRDPENAALAHDDVENLSWLQRVGRRIKEDVAFTSSVIATHQTPEQRARGEENTSLVGASAERGILLTQQVGRGAQALGTALTLRGYMDRVQRVSQVEAALAENGGQPMNQMQVAEALGIDKRDAAGMVDAAMLSAYTQRSPQERQNFALQQLSGILEDQAALDEYAALIVAYEEQKPPAEEFSRENFLRWAVAAGIEAAPLMIIMMGSAALGTATAGPVGGGSAMFTVGSLAGGGEISVEHILSGGDMLDPEFQARVGPGMVLYGATEFIGVAGRYARPLMGIDDQLLRRATLNWARGTGKAVAANSAEEFVNEFLQNLISEHVRTGEFDWTEEGIREKLMAGLQGAVVGAQFSMVTEVPGVVAESRQRAAAVNAEQETINIEQLNHAAAQTKTRERSPEKFNQLMQSSGMDRTFLYVDAAQLQAAVDAGQISVEATGLRTDQLATSAERGGRVAVRTSDFMTNIAGTDAAQVFLDHGVLSPDGYSKVEQAEIAQTERMTRDVIDASTAEMEALAQQRQAIEGDIYLQLREAGQGHNAARTGAQLNAAFLSTMSNVYGEDITGRFGLRVEGPTTLVEPSFVANPPIIPQHITSPEVQTTAPTPLVAPTEVSEATLTALSRPNLPQLPEGLQPVLRTDPVDVSGAVAPSKPEVQAEVKPLQQPSVELIANPPVLTPAEGNRLKLTDIGEHLTERHMNTYGRKLEPPTNPDDYQIVKDSLREELEMQLENVQSGVGWYSHDTDLAIRETARVYPSVAEPEGRAMYLMLAAVMSNNQTPVSAWKAVEPAYRAWDQTGTLFRTRSEAAEAIGEEVVMSTGKDKDGNPLNQPAGWTQRNQSVVQGIDILNYLIQREGSAVAAADWLAATHTPQEINNVMQAAGLKTPRFKTKAQLASDPQSGYLALGPKIGAYFNTLFQTDTGAEEAVIDVWFTRTYRRMTGGLMDGPIDPKTGLVAQPNAANNNAERSTIQQLARELSEEMGLPIEDVQAILWFYEQKLYTSLGVKSGSGTNSDGAKSLLEAHGIDFAADDGGAGATSDTELAGEAAQEQGSTGDTGAAPAVADVDYSQPVTEADLENLGPDFFRRPGWAALTADLSSLPDSIRESRNLENKELLRADLEARGIPYREVEGHYGTPEPENSFITIMDEETAMELGKKYQQDSVLTPSGLVYTSRPRPNTPIKPEGFLEGQAAIDQGFYSITEDGYAFATGLDFEQGPGNAVIPEGSIELDNRPQLPVDERDGMARLYHWSNVPLDVIDPDFAGSGPLTSNDRRSGQRVSFYGINPRGNVRDQGTGYVKEAGLGPHQHEARVDPARLYPWYQDPDHLKPAYEPTDTGTYRKPNGSMVTAAQMTQDYERAIKDAGYLGYYVTDDGEGSAPLGNVAKVFEPLPVKVVGSRSFDQSARPAGTVPENTIIDDETMEPVLFYHGTGAEFTEFKDGRTFFSNKRHLAVEHALRDRSEGKRPRVIQATLAFENPLVIGPVATDPDIYWLENTQAIEDAMAEGKHDGLLVYNSEGFAMAIADRPDQITQRDRHFNQPQWDGPMIPRNHAFEQLPEDDPTARGRITMPAAGVDQGESVIQLFETSDLSTFAHESGHWFLEVFKTLATEEAAPQSMREDLAGIHDWMENEHNVQVFDDAGQYTVEAQELWARGIETYLMEGRAPSQFLKQAFARFARWLTMIYRSMAGLNAELTPEIREVMDRMLATEQEIATIKNEFTDQALFADIPPGMTQQEWETYRKVAERADNEAQARMLGRVMEDIAKRDSKARREAKKRLTEEVEQELQDDPIYRFIDDAGERGLTLDTDQLAALIGEENMGNYAGTKHGRKLHKKNGADPRLVSELYGFDSVMDFLTSLGSALPRKWAKEMRVDQMLEQEFGPQMSEDELRAQAMLAIKNPAAQERVAREAAALSNASGQPRGPNRWQRQNAAARAEAQRRISETPVREIMKFRQYLRDSRKAAREAQAALAQVVRNAEGVPVDGSQEMMDRAAAAKRRQLIADHMFREASELALRIEKGRTTAARMDVKKVRENIGEPFIGTIDGILEQYDLRKAVTNKAVQNRMTLRELITEMEQQNLHGYLNLDPKLVMETRKKHYTELTGAEAESLFDAIENVAHAGRQVTKAKVEGERKALRATVAQITSTMDENMRDVELPRESGRRSAVRREFRRSVQWLKNADSTIIDLDGGDHQGFAYRAIKKDIDQAAARNQERREMVLRQLAELYRKYYSNKELRAMAKDSRPFPELGGEELTKKGIIAMALNAGNEGNWQRMSSLETKTGSYRPEAVEQVLVENMTEKDWQFVQEVWDFIDQFWPEISEQQLRLTGVRPKKVDAVLQIEGAPEFVTGGYFPIRYDRDISGMEAKNKRVEEAMDGFGGRYGGAQTRNGHTKERLNTVNEPLDLNLGIIEQHVLGVIYDLEFREPLMNAWKIVNDKEFGDAMLAKGRAEELDSMKIWLEDTAAGDTTGAYGLFEKGLRYMRNTFTISRLGLSFRTALIQPLGMTQSAVLLGKRTMIDGTMKYVTSPMEWSRFALENSPTMRERQRTMERDMNQISGQLSQNTLDGGRFRRFADATVPFLMFMMQKSQFYVADMATWVAAYEQKMSEGVSEKDAIDFADWAVRRAQGSGLMSDRAMVERGTTGPNLRRSELPKMFTVLSSYFFAKLNVTMERTKRFQNNKTPMEAINYAADMFLLFAFEAAIMSLFAMDWEDEDEITEDFMWEWANQTKSSVLAMFPIIRDVDSALAGFDGGVYDSYVSLANDATRVGTDLAGEAGIGEGEFDLQSLKSMTELGSLFFLPSAQINRVLNGTLEDDLELRDVPPGRMITDSLGLTRVPRD